MFDTEKRHSFSDFLNKSSTTRKVVTDEMRQLALTIQGSEDESKIQDLVGMQYQRSEEAKEIGPSFIQDALNTAIDSLVQMDTSFQVKLVMEELITKVVQKCAKSQEISYKEKIAKQQDQLAELDRTLGNKKELRKEREEECEQKVQDLRRIEKLNMNEKVRLLCRSKDLDIELTNALQQRERFKRMKDISQMDSKLVFKVLTYLEVADLAHIVATCRAWRFNLHKPVYWRSVRSQVWKRKWSVKNKPRFRNTPDTNPKTHIVRITRLANEPNTMRLFKKRSLAAYDKDAIYQECITKSGRDTATIASDRDDIAEKAKVGGGLVLFMRSKMRDAMNQLGAIRVKTYRQEQELQQARAAQQRLDSDIRRIEHEIEKQKGVIERHREKQQKMREAQRVYEDLQMLEEPGNDDEIRNVYAVKKAMVRKVLELRRDLKRVKKDTGKFKTRVETLSKSHDFLP